MTTYVSEGGIVIVPRIDDDAYFDFFGISGIESSKNRYLLEFDTEEDPVLFDLIDEEYEQSISLGRANGQDIYKTIAYETTTAKSLGHYDDGSNGFIKNVNGAGAAYAFGFAWKEVITRNQINRD